MILPHFPFRYFPVFRIPVVCFGLESPASPAALRDTRYSNFFPYGMMSVCPGFKSAGFARISGLAARIFPQRDELL